MQSAAGSGRYPFLDLTREIFLLTCALVLCVYSFIGLDIRRSYARIIDGYRHAIEEELEVLYDAYYEELEQYANYQQRYVSSGGTIPPPPGPGPFPGSVELDKNGAVIDHHPQNKAPHNPPPFNRTPALTNGRKPPKHESEFDDDEGDEDEYEEEEYEEDEEEEEEEEEEEVKPRDRRNPSVRGRRPVNNTKANGRDGLFNLGSSLTVTGQLTSDSASYILTSPL